MVYWGPPKYQSTTGRHLSISTNASFNNMLKFINGYFVANVELSIWQALILKIHNIMGYMYCGWGKIKFPPTFPNSSEWTNNLNTKRQNNSGKWPNLFHMYIQGFHNNMRQAQIGQLKLVCHIEQRRRRLRVGVVLWIETLKGVKTIHMEKQMFGK